MLHSMYFCVFGIFVRFQASSFRNKKKMLHLGIYLYRKLCKMERLHSMTILKLLKFYFQLHQEGKIINWVDG